MKKILTVIMTMLVCFAGCFAAGPRPPIKLFFAVHQSGATVSTELRVVEKHKYPFFLVFMFNEKDRADQERVRKLIGSGGKNKLTGKLVDPGIPIPLKITINVIDSSGERLFLEKEVLTMGMDSGPAINFFDRKVDLIELLPGLYRVTVQSLKDIPELMNTKVILCIYARQRCKS
jgi:hypothetical protein